MLEVGNARAEEIKNDDLARSPGLPIIAETYFYIGLALTRHQPSIWQNRLKYALCGGRN
jgi:hypothetical protein